MWMKEIYIRYGGRKINLWTTIKKKRDHYTNKDVEKS